MCGSPTGLQRPWSSSRMSRRKLQPGSGLPRWALSHYVFDDGNLVVAHAGTTEELAGRASGRCATSAFSARRLGKLMNSACRFVTTGLPTTEDRRLSSTATRRSRPEWLNGRSISTPAVCLAALTALRYPELEIISVPSHQMYAVPARAIPARNHVGVAGAAPPMNS